MSKLINPTRKAARKPFSQLVSVVPGLEEELTDGMSDLVHACTETGKTGEITLKIKVKPLSGKSGQVELDSDVKVKAPAPTRGKTLMFATPDNNLQRENPSQLSLDGLRTPAQEEDAQAEIRKTVAASAAPEAAPLRVVGGQ